MFGQVSYYWVFTAPEYTLPPGMSLTVNKQTHRQITATRDKKTVSSEGMSAVYSTLSFVTKAKKMYLIFIDFSINLCTVSSYTYDMQVRHYCFTMMLLGDW